MERRPGRAATGTASEMIRMGRQLQLLLLLLAAVVVVEGWRLPFPLPVRKQQQKVCSLILRSTVDRSLAFNGFDLTHVYPRPGGGSPGRLATTSNDHASQSWA